MCEWLQILGDLSVLTSLAEQGASSTHPARLPTRSPLLAEGWHDPVRGFVACDGCGVRAPRVLPGSRPQGEHGLPAAPPGTENGMFFGQRCTSISVTSPAAAEKDRGQIPQKHVPNPIIGPIKQSPGQVARAVDHEAATRATATRCQAEGHRTERPPRTWLPQKAGGVEEQVERQARCHHRVDVVPGHGCPFPSQDRGDHERPCRTTPPAGHSAGQVLDDLPGYARWDGRDHVRAPSPPDRTSLEPLNLGEPSFCRTAVTVREVRSRPR